MICVYTNGVILLLSVNLTLEDYEVLLEFPMSFQLGNIGEFNANALVLLVHTTEEYVNMFPSLSF